MVTKAKINTEKKNKKIIKPKIDTKVLNKKVVAEKSLQKKGDKVVEKNNQSATNKKIKKDTNTDTINKNLKPINPKLTKEEINKNMTQKVPEKINENVLNNKSSKDIKVDVVNTIDTSQMEEDRFDNTEVYDEGDIASALERGYITQALQKHKEKLAPETHPDFDGENCVSCGGEIPLLRLNMGRIRCVHCQEKLEKTKKMYAQK